MEWTTEQQSKQLIEIGVPVVTYDEMVGNVPRWSFTTLMQMLPATIWHEDKKYRLYMCKSGSGSYTLWYRPLHGGASLITLVDRSLTNLAYRTILKLKEGDYVKIGGWPRLLNLSKEMNRAYKAAAMLKKEEEE